MARRTLAAVVVVALVAVVGPAAGLAAPASDLDQARSELAEAARSLAEVEAAVRRTNDEVAALDDRLQAATALLTDLADELTAAEGDLAAARAAERDAAAALAVVDADLQATLGAWATARDRLADRVVHAYKHGGGATQEVLVRGVLGAGDLHDVAVTLETVERLATDERQAVDGSLALTRSTADLRAAAGAARATARSAAKVAAAEQRRVEDLVDRQTRLVADVTRDRAARAEALAALESDAAARAVLVRDLEQRVASLELAASRVFVPIQTDLDVWGPPPAWASRLPGVGGDYAAAIEATAARYGIDGRLLAALVWTESGFRPGAVSHAGAMGLAQLMPGTARGLRVDPRDPLQNLDGGARYLRSQLDRFGRVDLALAAYNAGPGRVAGAGPGVPDIVETQLYVVRVLDRYAQLTA